MLCTYTACKLPGFGVGLVLVSPHSDLISGF